jgi:hypothetical protein
MSWDYVQICGRHDHPNANNNGVILEHRLVMSDYLGRPLEDDEIVHHCDSNQRHNEIENLELTLRGGCPENHNAIHNGTGRTFLSFICPACNIEFLREKGNAHPNTTPCCSRSCSGKWSHIKRRSS